MMNLVIVATRIFSATATHIARTSTPLVQQACLACFRLMDTKKLARACDVNWETLAKEIYLFQEEVHVVNITCPNRGRWLGGPLH